MSRGIPKGWREGWTASAVTIQVRKEPHSNEGVPMQIDAEVRDCWAVHPETKWDGGLSDFYFVLTHVPTGYAVSTLFNSLDAAKLAAAFMDKAFPAIRTLKTPAEVVAAASPSALKKINEIKWGNTPNGNWIDWESGEPKAVRP